MKPPPRKRTKTDRLKIEPIKQPTSTSRPRQWTLLEQKKLLEALKRHSRTNNGLRDIDCAFLGKHVSSRSTSEILSAVEYLKDSVISLASFKLKKNNWEEKKARKPIEVWTHMASTIAGTLEESISTAFSQMLIVSSTEPCILRNCDPPQVYRPPMDKNRPGDRTVPMRPMPRGPVEAENPGTTAARPLLVLKTPAPAMGPAKRLPTPFQVVRVTNGKPPPPQQQLSTTAGSSPATTPTSQSAATSCTPSAAKILAVPSTCPQTVTPVTGVSPTSGSTAVKTPSVGCSLIQTTPQPSEQHPTTSLTTSTSKSTSSSPHTSLSPSATSRTPVPSTAPSSGASSDRPMPPLSTPAADFHARFGRTNKYATKDSPRIFGVKSVVDFERIYRYLSLIHQPNDDCHLTPMESAIVLDLLMSLPEELPLLDCNKLHKHLIKVYQSLSSNANSKMAAEMFKELKDERCTHTEAASSQDSNRTDGQQNAAGTADSTNVTDNGGKKVQPDEAESQSSDGNKAPESNNASGQSRDADMIGHCPLLNPFLVPLKLLMRK